MPKLTKIGVEKFRCFVSPQETRVAPLTFLVGENSTGKTSFLALVRALWDAAVLGRIPDFTESPYHLGTFNDIVSSNGNPQSDRAFKSQLSFMLPWEKEQEIRALLEFRDRGGIPFPISRKFSLDSVSIELVANSDGSHLIKCQTPSQEWRIQSRHRLSFGSRMELLSLGAMWFDLVSPDLITDQATGTLTPSRSALEELAPLLNSLTRLHNVFLKEEELFASAPVRSRPKRTYDLGRPSIDPEGENIPMYLANMKLRDQERWTTMKHKLESVGKQLGLFDKIDVISLLKGAAGPFQIQVRRYGPDNERTSRNLIDVGYGVSQILPLLTELLHDGAPSLCLLQQPEVHLHPSAQAALGAVFAEVCSGDHQLIVETHSDYLINRVRMDIRDNRCMIDEKDVSILYFETVGESVEIHSISLDKMGNILGAPPSYRRFFLAEVDREIQV